MAKIRKFSQCIHLTAFIICSVFLQFGCCTDVAEVWDEFVFFFRNQDLRKHFYSQKNANGHCVWYGVCRNYEDRGNFLICNTFSCIFDSTNFADVDKSQYCSYKGPAKLLNEEGREKLMKYCSYLDGGENNTFTCCDSEQVLNGIFRFYANFVTIFILLNFQSLLFIVNKLNGHFYHVSYTWSDRCNERQYRKSRICAQQLSGVFL